MASLVGKLLNRPANRAAPVQMTSRVVYGGSSYMAGGDQANVRAYKSQGTVHSNVSLLASSAAKPEWSLYRKQPQDGRRRYTTSDQGSDQRVQVTRHQALTVLSKPATVMSDGREIVIWTRTGLFEISGIWLETTGKSHWVVEYDPRASFPVGLWPVPPWRMTPVPDPKAYQKGWIYTSPDGREQIPLRMSDVIFNRYPDPEDVYGGTGPIGSVLANIDAARLAAQWNRGFFENSAEPGGVIELDPSVEDVDFDAMEARWREAHRGVARAHRVAVLEAGAKWVTTSTSPKDMDFQNLSIEMRDEIREALGMHKVMTGVTDDVNRANAQTGEEVFSSWKIVPRLDRWKEVLNTQFLPLFGSTASDVEFDYSFPMPLNREQDNAELQAKATAAQLLVSAGYDPSDVLEVVGLPDMGTAPPPAPPAAPAPQDDTTPPDDATLQALMGIAPREDDMHERLRRVLANGHVPVATGRY
jgi:HK97 family phage portal protein